MSRNGNTRKQLIDAAYQVLARVGYEATSIKGIAKEAGVSPGLVHYYFANKEELLAAVVKEATDEYCLQMERMRESVFDENLVNAALAEPMRRVQTHADWYRLRYELFVLGLRNDTIRLGVQEMLQKGRGGIAKTVETVAGQSLPTAQSMSAILLACFDGLALQALVDPDFDLAGAYTVLRQMGFGYLESQTVKEDGI